MAKRLTIAQVARFYAGRLDVADIIGARRFLVGLARLGYDIEAVEKAASGMAATEAGQALAAELRTGAA